MTGGIAVTGIPSWEELNQSPGLPDAKRFEIGPVAFIECVQRIPCNPCEKACPMQAIVVGEPITNLPRLDGQKCNGCGRCLSACPGLAIFRVHKNFSDSTASIEFPFEFFPLPEKGEIVLCVDRQGNYITSGKVLNIRNPLNNDGTALITVEIPKEYFLQVRSMKRK